MLWVKKGTHVIDHERFLAAGAVARDLYDWGLLYSGKHELDGNIPIVAVLSSAWGAGMKANIKPAMKLVEVGLWERTDSGFRILKWAEQGNMTAAQLAADRAGARERKARRDSEKVRANDGRTNVEVPTSTSTSECRSPEPRQIGIASSPPDWFAVALDVIAMSTGETLPPGDAWLRYSGHRSPPGSKAMSQPDAQYWLTTVMVPEQRKARDEAARRTASDRERTQAFVQQRSGPEVKPQDSRKELRERDEWAKQAGPPDPETQRRMRALLGGIGKVGT